MTYPWTKDVQVGSFITNHPDGVLHVSDYPAIQVEAKDLLPRAVGPVKVETEQSWSWTWQPIAGAGLPLLGKATFQVNHNRKGIGGAYFQCGYRTRITAKNTYELLKQALQRVMDINIPATVFVVPTVYRTESDGVAAVTIAHNSTLGLSFDTRIVLPPHLALPPVTGKAGVSIDHTETTAGTQTFVILARSRPQYGQPYCIRKKVLARMLHLNRYFVVDNGSGKLLGLKDLENLAQRLPVETRPNPKSIAEHQLLEQQTQQQMKERVWEQERIQQERDSIWVQEGREPEESEQKQWAREQEIREQSEREQWAREQEQAHGIGEDQLYFDDKTASITLEEISLRPIQSIFKLASAKRMRRVYVPWSRASLEALEPLFRLQSEMQAEIGHGEHSTADLRSWKL